MKITRAETVLDEARASWVAQEGEGSPPIFTEEHWARAAMADPDLDDAVVSVVGVWPSTQAYFDAKAKRHRLGQVLPNMNRGSSDFRVWMPELSVEGVRKFQGRD